MKQDLASNFQRYAELQARRVLTQLDRDPDSPTFGCFDRQYWHYKTRDFPSSILQQGISLLEAIRKGHVDVGVDATRVENWAVAAVNALSRQVSRAGAVDEYYPREQSYPAAAFGLYGAARVLQDWQRDDAALLERVEWDGLRRLAAHLSSRTEVQASNQYAAGIAALAMGAALPQLAIDPDCVAIHASRLLKLQHAEGWFPEYGGPDFGYLSVTLDALADYGDATGDERARQAATRAVDFVASLVGADRQLPWTLNSRNTDYFVPYGLVRLSADNSTAAWLVDTLFSRLATPQHPLWATDDRYHLHYIFASVLRSLPHLGEIGAATPPSPRTQVWFPGCGHWAVWSKDRQHTLYVGARKGGLVRVHSRSGPCAVDHGWRVAKATTVWTNNWWSDRWSARVSGDGITVEGNLQNCRHRVSTPLSHLVLRGLAWVFGRRIIPALKRLMIFRPGGGSKLRFRREVRVGANGFRLEDVLVAEESLIATPAPRQNLRHVASADSFHPEELAVPILGTEPLALDPRGCRSVDWDYV